METLKEIVEYNAKQAPNKPFLGTRTRIVDAVTKETSFGLYEWRT
jgi:hypothetical protein